VATFVEDNNIPDGHIFPPGAEFIKSWKMKNDGAKDWPSRTQLAFVGGNRLAAFKDAPSIYEVGKVGPGETVDVWAGDLKAPEEPGTYNSFWRLLDNGTGHFFGHRLWVTIEVVQPNVLSSSGLSEGSGEIYSNPSLSSSALAMPGAFFTREQQEQQVQQVDVAPAEVQTHETGTTATAPSVSISVSITGSSIGDDVSLLNADSEDGDNEDDGSEIEIPVMPASTATLAPAPIATIATVVHERFERPERISMATEATTVATVPSVTAVTTTTSAATITAATTITAGSKRSKSPSSSSDSDSEDEFVVVYDSASEDVM
jgi:next-to-BRCA1 protein 1